MIYIETIRNLRRTFVLVFVLFYTLVAILACDDFFMSVEDNINQNKNNNDYYLQYGTVSIENAQVSAFLDTQYNSYDYNYTNITDFVSLNNTQRLDFSEGLFLNWENSNDAAITQIEYATNPQFVDKTTIDIANGAVSYKLCNLIPDNIYWVKIINNNSIVKQLTFSTIGRRRLINLNVGFNCRDIGGIKTTDNRIVKYGLFFRGGELDGQGQVLDKNDHNVLENVIKIKDVFDFRTASTNKTTPIVGAEYHSIPLYSMIGIYDRDNPDNNRYVLDNYSRVLKILLDCLTAGRSVYAHCQGGCDRTNTMTFLILGVLGVDENELALDYELSSFAQGAPYAYNDMGGMIRSRAPQTNPYHNNYCDAIQYIKSLPGNTLKDKFEFFWVNKLGVSPLQIEELRLYMLSNIPSTNG